MTDPKHQTKRALSSLGWWFVAGVFIAAATIDALGIFGIAEGPHALVRWLFGLALRAGFDFPVHAHMLRHGCGYAFANAFRTGSGIAGSSAPCVTLSHRPQGLGTFWR